MSDDLIEEDFSSELDEDNPVVHTEESDFSTENDRVPDPYYGEAPPEYTGIDTSLVPAMKGVESGGDPYAVSPKGARGSMQVMPAMWDAYGGGDWTDDEESTRVGTAILKDELARFNGNDDLAVAAYNAGSPRVINALEDAGFTLKQAGQVPFEKIERFLPQETQDYVRKVNAARQGSVPSPDADTPAEDDSVGSTKDLVEELNPVISDPEFSARSTQEKIRVLQDTYVKHRYWSPEAQAKFKELSTAVIDAALPNEVPNYAALAGEPPELSATDAKADEAVINQWKRTKLQELEKNGINPIFLGNQFDESFKQAAAEEKLAAEYRNRGAVGTVLKPLKSAVQQFIGGGVGSFTSAAAYPLRGIGANDTADSLESINNILGDPAPDFNFQVDGKGHLVRDEYGRPKTKLQGSVASALGQVGATIVSGAGVLKYTKDLAKVDKFMLGFNTLQTANDAYKDARENGGTHNQALLASVFSMPSAAVDTLGDHFIFAGGPIWLKGLTPYNKARAVAGQFIKQGLVGGATEGSQQLLQDLGTSQAINENIVSRDRIIDATLAGAIAQGAAGTGVSAYQGYADPNGNPANKPPPVQPPPPGNPPAGPAPFTPYGYQGPQSPIVLPPQPSSQGSTGVIRLTAQPNPEEQVRITQQFQEFQNSTDMERVFTVRSVDDITPDMLGVFGYTAEVQEDGRVKIVKQITHVPEETTSAEPERLQGRITKLTTELANAPRPEEHQELAQREVELTQELSTVDEKAKSQYDAYEQYAANKKQLEQDIKELDNLYKNSRSNKKPDAAGVRQLIRQERAQKTEALHKVNAFLREATAGKRAYTLQRELREVKDALKQLGRPTYVNDLKAKEAELKNLLVTQDLVAQDTAEKKVADEAAAKAEDEKPKGIRIQTKEGDKFVLPFQGRWHVLDAKGTPLSQGHDSLPEALDTARGVIKTQAEGYVLAVTPPEKVQVRPTVLKQRRKSPFTILPNDATAVEEETTEGPTGPPETSARAAGPTEQATETAKEESKEQDADAAPEPAAYLKPSLPNRPLTTDYVQLPSFTRDRTIPVNVRKLLKQGQKILDSLARFNPYRLREGGRGAVANALGYINYGKRYIWNKTINDIPTAVHEIAHAINSEKFPDWTVYSTKLLNALKDMAGTFYPDPTIVNADIRKQVYEGWSMFLQNYFTRMPVHKDILDFYQNQFKKDFPKVYKDLEAFKGVIEQFYSMDEITHALAFASAEDPKKELKKGDFVDNWLDAGAVLETIDNIVGSNLKDFYDYSKGLVRQKMTELLNVGFTNWQGQKVSGALPYDQAIAPAKGMEAELVGYLVAKRTVAQDKRGIDAGFSLVDARAIINKIESDPAKYRGVIQAAQNVYDFQENILDLAGERSQFFAKSVSQMRAANLKNTQASHGYYVPFAREFDKDTGLSSSKVGSNSDPFARFRGSNRRIKNPLLQIPLNSQRILQRAQNRSLIDGVTGLANLNTPIGEFVRKLNPDQVPTVNQAAEALKAKVDEQLKAEGLPPLDKDAPEYKAIADELVSTFEVQSGPYKPADGYVVMAVNQGDGRFDFYEMNPRVFKVLNPEMSAFANSGPMRWFYRVPNQILKAGATSFRLSYQLRNFLFRDFATAYRRSGDYNPFTLAKDVLSSLGTEAITSFTAGKYQFAWGGLAKRLGAQAATLQNQGRDLDAVINKSTGKPVINLAKQSLDYIENLLSAGERATRLALFKQKARELGINPNSKTITPQQAIELVLAYKRGTTDFSVQGRKAAVLNQGVPFFTARIAELTQLKRDFRENKAKSAAYAAGFLALGISQALANKDEEWYKNLEPEEKATNFLTTIKDSKGNEKTLRIPLETLGGLFNGLGSIIGNQILRDDSLKPSAKEELIGYLKNYTPIPVSSEYFGFGTLVEAAGVVPKEIVQQIANRDLFFKRNIVPRGQEEKALPDQYTAGTTEFAKSLGSAMNWSPARIDHAMRGIFPASIDMIKFVEEQSGARPINEGSDLDPITDALTRSGFKESVLDRSSNKFYDMEAKFRANKDIETAKEGEARKKLTKLKDLISDVNTVLSAQPDNTFRTELYSKKAELFKKGLAIASGQNTAVQPIKETGIAKSIKEKRKRDRAAAQENRTSGSLLP